MAGPGQRTAPRIYLPFGQGRDSAPGSGAQPQGVSAACVPCSRWHGGHQPLQPSAAPRCTPQLSLCSETCRSTDRPNTRRDRLSRSPTASSRRLASEAPSAAGSSDRATHRLVPRAAAEPSSSEAPGLDAALRTRSFPERLLSDTFLPEPPALETTAPRPQCFPSPRPGRDAEQKAREAPAARREAPAEGCSLAAPRPRARARCHRPGERLRCWGKERARVLAGATRLPWRSPPQRPRDVCEDQTLPLQPPPSCSVFPPPGHRSPLGTGGWPGAAPESGAGHQGRSSTALASPTATGTCLQQAGCSGGVIHTGIRPPRARGGASFSPHNHVFFNQTSYSTLGWNQTRFREESTTDEQVTLAPSSETSPCCLDCLRVPPPAPGTAALCPPPISCQQWLW